MSYDTELPETTDVFMADGRVLRLDVDSVRVMKAGQAFPVPGGGLVVEWPAWHGGVDVELQGRL